MNRRRFFLAPLALLLPNVPARGATNDVLLERLLAAHLEVSRSSYVAGPFVLHQFPKRFAILNREMP